MMYRVAGVCLMVVFVALAPPAAWAQQTRGSLTLTGQVSGVAAVSVGSEARVVRGAGQVSAGRAGADAVVVSLSGLAEGETEVDIPVQVRSNVAFALTAACAGRGAAVSGLSVVEVSGAGRFVQPGAAGRVEVSAAFEGRRGARAAAGCDLSSPVTVLHGPPVSMSGTLESPGNMIEVVLRVVLKAPAGSRGRAAEVKVSAAPRRQGS